MDLHETTATTEGCRYTPIDVLSDVFTKSRKSLRLKDFDYSSHRAYFVTICSALNGDIFGTVSNYKMVLNTLGNMIAEVWNNIFMIYTSITKDEFIVMPNHFHGILIITDDSKNTLGTYIGRFKSYSTHLYKEYQLSINEDDRHLWQRNYYDHIIRNESSMLRIREYIKNNPARWHLDKENPFRSGKDDFDTWLDSFTDK